MIQILQKQVAPNDREWLNNSMAGALP